MFTAVFQILLVFTLNARVSSACPPGTPSPGRSIPITRQIVHVQNKTFLAVFDVTFAQQELRAVLEKYKQAPRFLQGFDLTPAPDFPAYFPSDKQSVFNSNIEIDASTSTYNTTDTPLIPPVVVETGTGMLPLVDLISGGLDVLYYGRPDFGTPRQSLTVDIDTGSADLWIPVDCRNCNEKIFDSRMSSTYRNHERRVSIAYGSGAVTGKLASDVVSMAGLTVEDQMFVAVNRESGDFNSYPIDGLLGMAFSTIAQSKKLTFFENLMREEKLAAPLFSVHLTRNQEQGSEVCFGCYDPTKAVGTVSWVPVKSKTYWTVSMDSLVINSRWTVPTVDVTAAIDTGTTLVYIPKDMAADFYDKIPGAKPASQYGPEFYTYPCAAQLEIAFSFNNQSFSLHLFDFNLGRTSIDSPDCVGGILALGDGFPSNLAIIGDEFLKSWYTTFDYSNGGRVGFSPSVNNKN